MFLIDGKSLCRRAAFAGSYRTFAFCAHTAFRSNRMMDLVVLAIGLVFFALSIAYVYACDGL
jgi:hypothetical protein